MKEFEMTYNDLINYYFGIKVKQSASGILISQKGYAESILEK